MSNKRGQESSNAVTGWLGALIVLVVVALVAWAFFSYLGASVRLAPDQLTAAASYCENSPYKNNPEAYCGSDYKPFKIKGKTAYYSCYDIAIQIAPMPKWSVIDCRANSDNAAKKRCVYFNTTGELEDSGNSVYISGALCEYNSKTGELNWNNQNATIEVPIVPESDVPRPVA